MRLSTFTRREHQPRGREPGQPVTEGRANFKNPSQAPSSASTIALGRERDPQGKQESRARAGPCSESRGPDDFQNAVNGQTRPACSGLPLGGGCRQKSVLWWPSVACATQACCLPTRRASPGLAPGGQEEAGLDRTSRPQLGHRAKPTSGKRQVPCVPWWVQAPEDRALTSPLLSPS